MLSDSISDHLILLIFLGGHATRPRQGTPTFSKPVTPLFQTGNEGPSCFPTKIKLLDRTLTTQSQWAERRQIVLLMSWVPGGSTTKSSVRPVHHFHSCCSIEWDCVVMINLHTYFMKWFHTTNTKDKLVIDAYCTEPTSKIDEIRQYFLQNYIIRVLYFCHTMHTLHKNATVLHE